MKLPSSQRQWHLLGRQAIEFRQVELGAPRRGELVMRIDTATTCGTDLKVFRQGGHARMLTPPCPFGHEMAGTVAAIGPATESFVPGDRIVVANSASCGHCLDCRRGRENLCGDLRYLNGAFAEFLSVPERFVRRSSYLIPATLTSEIAALAEPLACLVHCLERLQPLFELCARATHGKHASDTRARKPRTGAEATTGHNQDAPTAVVYGAGPVGLLLVGLLTRQGARVLSCDPNPSRLEMTQRFGAVATKTVARSGNQAASVLETLGVEAKLRTDGRSGEPGFDIAVDATGSSQAWLDAVHSVRRGGHVVFVGGTEADVRLEIDARWIHYSEITLHGTYHHRPETFVRALSMLEARALPFELLISERRPLEELDKALLAMAERRALKVALS